MAHAAEPTLHGLMAEFENATALVDARNEGAPRGLSQDGRLFADPD